MPQRVASFAHPAAPRLAEPRPADLARRVEGRRWVDRILAAARALPKRDRLLVELAYHHGVPVAHLAQLLQTDRRIVQRRLARILRRLRRPGFAFVATQLDLLPRELHPVARHYFLHGLSQRDTAQHTGRSLHQTRLDLQSIATLAKLFHGK